MITVFVFDGILLKPGLLQPGFHVAGYTSSNNSHCNPLKQTLYTSGTRSITDVLTDGTCPFRSISLTLTPRYQDTGPTSCPYDALDTARKGGMTRLETLIELKFLTSSFSAYRQHNGFAHAYNPAGMYDVVTGMYLRSQSVSLYDIALWEYRPFDALGTVFCGRAG